MVPPAMRRTTDRAGSPGYPRCLADGPKPARLAFGGMLLIWAGACTLDFDRPGALVHPELRAAIDQKERHWHAHQEDTKALVDLAGLYLEAGQLFKAVTSFSRARKKAPDNTRIAAGLAEGYLELGYVRASVEELRGCFRVNREEPDCLWVFGSLLERDGSTEAIRQARLAWNRLLAVAPGHPRAAYIRSAIAQIDAKLGPARPTDAQPSTQPGPSAPPEAPIPKHPVPKTEGQDVGALNAFGQAIQRAFLAMQKRDPGAAETAYKEALQLSPDDPSAMAGLSEALFAQRKQQEAQKIIEDAYKKHKQSPQVLFAYGLILSASSQGREKALGAWKTLLNAHPEYAQQLRLKARIQALQTPGSPPAGEPKNP